MAMQRRGRVRATTPGRAQAFLGMAAATLLLVAMASDAFVTVVPPSVVQKPGPVSIVLNRASRAPAQEQATGLLRTTAATALLCLAVTSARRGSKASPKVRVQAVMCNDAARTAVEAKAPAHGLFLSCHWTRSNNEMVKMTILALLFLLMICFSEVDRARGYGYDPCSNYRKLSAADRAEGFNKLTFKSDKRSTWKEDWYRFIGKAGDKMATLDINGGGCPKSPACGAKFPAYLLKPHPDNLSPGESKEATICYSTGKTCCEKTQKIMIKKCTGFFIYKLPRACVKRGRYCGNGGHEKPDCDEKTLLFGLTKKYAAESCKDIKEKRKDADSGVYWIKPDGINPVQAYCDQETDGGGWTLVYSYTFTNFKNFRSGSNAITPRPTWPISNDHGNIYPSTTPPKSETDYNAMDFQLWNDLGHEFMVKSNINHWIACKEGSGSLVDFRHGTLQCRIIKNVATKCHNYVPDQLILHSAGNPAGSTLGPDLIRSQSSSWLKEYYYFEANTRTGNWPTHDPCGTNGLNHLTNVNGPRGNIYIRE